MKYYWKSKIHDYRGLTTIIFVLNIQSFHIWVSSRYDVEMVK